MSAREMSRGEKLDFVKSHLEGAAREEVRLFPKEALRWSEEEEKPWRSTHESASREVMSDVVESKECNSSTASTPLQQVLDALLKQQQSTEDLTKTMQAMRSVEPNPMNQSRNHQTAKPKRKCFSCGKEGHIARYCRSKLPEKGPSAESGNTKQ